MCQALTLSLTGMTLFTCSTLFAEVFPFLLELADDARMLGFRQRYLCAIDEGSDDHEDDRTKVPNFPNFLFLWVGISCLTNLFPQIEDALTLKEQIYGKGKSNLFVKIIAAPIFAVLYVGSYLQSVGLTLVTSVVFSLFMPSILGTFIPQLYNAIAG